ncbi:acetyltransferase [Aphelenchoides avenae]|nr:acetyltransferase [Aphelenchus avenae]
MRHHVIEKASPSNFKEIWEFVCDALIHAAYDKPPASGEIRDTLLWIKAIVQLGLESNLSCVARSCPDRRVIGVRLARELHRPGTETVMGPYPIGLEASRLDPYVGQVHPIWRDFERRLWSLVPVDVHQVVHWTLVLVRNDYSESGVYDELILFKLFEPRGLNSQAAVAEALTPEALKGYKEAGYSVLHEKVDTLNDNPDSKVTTDYMPAIGAIVFKHL